MSIEERNHPAVRVCVGKYDELIDGEIAPLIREIWRAGIMSCQNSDGQIWIEFDCTEGIEMFLEAIAPSETDPSTMYSRMAWIDGDIQQWWTYEISHWDARSERAEGSSEVSEEGGPNRPIFIVSPSLRFPRFDLAEVTQRMAAFNRSAAA